MNNSRAACANPKQAYFMHDIGGRAIPRKTRTWPTKLKNYSPKLTPAPRIKARSYKCIVVGDPRAAGSKQTQKKEIESTTLLKKTITASRALSELKGAITNLPNPILFIDTINLQEARGSSAIENIITAQDELFKASIADKK